MKSATPKNHGSASSKVLALALTIGMALGVTTAPAFDPETFSKPADKNALKQSLTELQYRVTQQDATEKPFDNVYWDNQAEGIYVDIVSGEPLFSSTHKYKSGTGWPSFWQTIEPDNIVLKKDFFLFYPRTELRSRYADSHLGHVFDDGPEPSGKRYCINSAALEFIPAKQLSERGYAEYLALFEATSEPQLDHNKD